MEQDTQRVSFPERDTRTDAMHSTVETWAEKLVGLVDDATSSESFRKWLDVQSRFHEYSSWNTLPIAVPSPKATHISGYRSRQTDLYRHVFESQMHSLVLVSATISA